jgi:hypothetical protein
MSALDTTFGTDQSSWDNTLTSKDGIEVVIVKLSDGDHFYENPSFAAKLTAARDLGCTVLGGYHVLWGNQSIANQAAWWWQLLNQRLPWWSEHPFICMSDNEPFGYNQPPTIAQVNEFHDRIIVLSGGRITAALSWGYSPDWHYGTLINSQRYPWWASSYGTNPVGPYRAVYPGNASPRWVGVNSARHADALQYASNATVDGLTTCDVSALVGNLTDVLARLGAAQPPAPTGDDMPVAYVLANFPGQPSWTQGAYHVADNSPAGYHVAPREPGMNAAAWPNAPQLSPTNVPAKYPYSNPDGGPLGIVEILFGVPQPAGGQGGADVDEDHTHTVDLVIAATLTGKATGATGPAVPLDTSPAPAP